MGEKIAGIIISSIISTSKKGEARYAGGHALGSFTCPATWHGYYHHSKTDCSTNAFGKRY
jgi:hypothetical protein